MGSAARQVIGASTSLPSLSRARAESCRFWPTSRVVTAGTLRFQRDDPAGSFGQIAAAQHEGRRDQDSPAAHSVPEAGLLAMSRSARFGVADPALGVGSLGGAGEEGAQVLGCLLHVAPLQQQKRHAVVGPAQAVVQLQGPLVVPDGLFRLAGLGERDGHVQQDAGVGRIVPKREPVGGKRGLEVSLAFQGQALVEIVEPLRAQVSSRAPLPNMRCQKLIEEEGSPSKVERAQGVGKGLR